MSGIPDCPNLFTEDEIRTAFYRNTKLGDKNDPCACESVGQLMNELADLDKNGFSHLWDSLYGIAQKTFTQTLPLVRTIPVGLGCLNTVEVRGNIDAVVLYALKNASFPVPFYKGKMPPLQMVSDVLQELSKFDRSLPCVKLYVEVSEDGEIDETKLTWRDVHAVMETNGAPGYWDGAWHGFTTNGTQITGTHRGFDGNKCDINVFDFTMWHHMHGSRYLVFTDVDETIKSEIQADVNSSRTLSNV